MTLDNIRTKAYEVPLNIPVTTAHKYIEVIEKGYAKYLEIIDLCGKFIMYQQFYKLVGILERSLTTDESRERTARYYIKRLKELGFIDNGNINKNKFLYLKKPGFAFTTGDYINSSRINLAKDLKNDRFQISILKVEYLLQYGEIIHNSTMFNQLMNITNNIYNTIIKTDNNYGYSVESIERLLELESYKEITDYLAGKSEHECRLGIIRGLWNDLGSFYRKMVLQKQTVTHKPEYYKLFVKKDGEVILHYIANIIIFDVSHDKKFYRDKSEKLFHAFYSIEKNSLREVQKTYISHKTMGYQGENHIGYKLTLIGADEKVLNEKKLVVDEDIDSSPTSPLMDFTTIVPLLIGNYMLHASRKGNEYQNKQDRMIDNLILKQIMRLSEKETKLKEGNKKVKPSKKGDSAAGKKILDMVNGD